MIPKNIVDSNFNEEELLNSSYELEKSDTFSTISQSSHQQIPNILDDLLSTLWKCGKKKVWNNIGPKMLYKYHLADHEAIESSFLVTELDVMYAEFKAKTNHSLFLKSDNKKPKFINYGLNLEKVWYLAKTYIYKEKYQN